MLFPEPCSLYLFHDSDDVLLSVLDGADVVTSGKDEFLAVRRLAPAGVAGERRVQRVACETDVLVWALLVHDVIVVFFCVTGSGGNGIAVLFLQYRGTVFSIPRYCFLNTALLFFSNPRRDVRLRLPAASLQSDCHDSCFFISTICSGRTLRCRRPLPQGFLRPFFPGPRSGARRTAS